MGKINITQSVNYNSKADELIEYEDIDIYGNADPTSRVLEGSSDHGFTQEWVADCRLLDGREGQAVYLFDEDDVTDDEGEPLEAENYPWDEDHLHRVRLID